MSNFIIKEKFPNFKDFNNLIKSIGWSERPKFVLKENKKKSNFCVSIYDDYDLVGFGRIVGDGSFYTFFDIVVKKTYQGSGIGKIVMENLLSQIEEKVKNKYHRVYLGSSKGKENFYEKFGFKKRPTEDVGYGMILNK